MDDNKSAYEMMRLTTEAMIQAKMEEKLRPCNQCGCELYQESGPCRGATEIKAAERRGAIDMLRIVEKQLFHNVGRIDAKYKLISILAEWEKQSS